MTRWLVGPLLVVLCVLASAAPARAQRIFADGFESSCASDADGDRLDGCAEALAQTDPEDDDTDGDGLSDGDEVLGTLGGLDLPGMGVDPRRKDILLEYDWYVDSSEAGKELCPQGVSHSHKPTQEMLDIVTVMFAAAPVSNPDGSTGIHLIHDVGQGGLFVGGTEVVDSDGDGVLQGDVYDAQFDAHYAGNFADNRKGYFHYVMLPHRYVAFDGESDYSGFAELPAGIMRDEMIVSLYCRNSVSKVAYTIAHELGHNLGLHHGGDTDCNYKPNYNSVMNYRYQFPGVDTDCDGAASNGPADYSQGLRNTLDENDLDEHVGLCGGVPIDWNGQNGIESSVKADLNFQDSFEHIWCGGTHTVLSDFDDWANAAIDMTPLGNEQGNVPPPETQDPAVLCPPPPPENP